MAKDIFKKGTKKNLTRVTSRGVITIIDLWQLPTTHVSQPNLLDIGKSIKEELNTMTTTDELDDLAGQDCATNEKAADLVLFYEIIKEIIKDKRKDELRAKEKLEAEQNDRVILDLIAKKKLSALEEKDLDILESMLSKNKKK